MGLADAWANAVAVPAPTILEPSLTPEDAYVIQDLVIAERLQPGCSIAGWKMGLTSAPPPTTPIVGTLLDDMVLLSGSELTLSHLVAPMVEAEVVVRIGELIDGPRTVVELERGPHEVGPGIEVIDYRTAGSQGVIDWIADNSTTAYAVVGGFVSIGDISPQDVEASLSSRGRHLATGRGAQVMGNPLAAVAWLSGFLAERGHKLRPGQIILTGSLTGNHPVIKEQDDFAAEFGALGTVSVAFRHSSEAGGVVG